MGFPRQEYWSGLPFPSPGDLPDPGIKYVSSASKVDSLQLSHQGSPFTYLVHIYWTPTVAQLVKNPPAMQETWVRSPYWEDSPREGKGYPLQSMGSQRVRYHWETFTSLSLHCITNKNEFYLSSILTWWHFQNTIFKNYGRCIFPKTHGTFIQIGRKTSPNILK